MGEIESASKVCTSNRHEVALEEMRLMHCYRLKFDRKSNDNLVKASIEKTITLLPHRLPPAHAGVINCLLL